MGEEDSNTKPHKPCDAATSSSSSAEEDFNTLSAEDRMKITAPRKITNDEVLALCKLMKNEFNVVDEETDDDADALLEYAVDMIDGGKSVDMVMKEVSACVCAYIFAFLFLGGAILIHLIPIFCANNTISSPSAQSNGN